MEKMRNWKEDLYRIWGGEGVWVIRSGVVEMGMMWDVRNRRGCGMVL